MFSLRSLRLLALLGLCVASFASAAAAEDRTPLYYREPSGAPNWSAVPKKAADGRDYLPVYDDAAVPAPPKRAAPDPTRKILYYRNPMGLPDTSPTPKKDSMGMDYVPVYADEQSDDGTVKLSPGKIQRSGVVSEPAMRQALHVRIKRPASSSSTSAASR